MPEYSRPNLSIPSTLWGEVKVAAFRCGKRPQELVIECLKEKYESPSSGRFKVDSKLVESVTLKPEAPKPISGMGSKLYPETEYKEHNVATVTCFKCKAKVQKWTMDARGKPWCDDCLEDARNAIP